MDRLGMMEVFVLAVETGSFSAVAPPAGAGAAHCLPRLIAQLEEHLGSRLLHPRPLMPTGRGGPVAEVQEILLQVNRGHGAAVPAGLSGRLRVNAPSPSPAHCHPRLAGFLAGPSRTGLRSR